MNTENPCDVTDAELGYEYDEHAVSTTHSELSAKITSLKLELHKQKRLLEEAKAEIENQRELKKFWVGVKKEQRIEIASLKKEVERLKGHVECW